jgi:hypothetical protein
LLLSCCTGSFPIVKSCKVAFELVFKTIISYALKALLLHGHHSRNIAVIENLIVRHIHKVGREVVEYRPNTCFSAMEFTVIQSQSSNLILDILDLEHGCSPLLFNSIWKFIKVKIISSKKGTHWMRFWSTLIVGQALFVKFSGNW